MQSIELIFREFLSFLSIKNHSQNYSLIPKGCNFEYFILLYSPNPWKKQANRWLNIQNYFPFPKGCNFEYFTLLY